MVDESLIDNKDVLMLIAAFKQMLQQNPAGNDKNYFVYHPDHRLSSFAVSLLNFPYEESERWKTEFSQDTGFRQQLFEQKFEDFMRIVAKENAKELTTYLKMEADTTHEEVESVLNYLKLRKVKRMLLENQVDLEKSHTAEEFRMLHQTHEHLKNMEIGLTKKMGAVVMR